MQQSTANILVVIVGVLALTAVVAASGVAAQSTTDFNRSIADQELAPGETTTVTVDVSVDAQANLELSDKFTPAFTNAEIVDGDGALIADTKDNETIANWPSDSDVTLTYEVTVPNGAADGDQFVINGTVTVDGTEYTIGGDSVITVSVPEDPSVTVSDQESAGNSIVIDEAVPGPDSEYLAVWNMSNGQPDTILGSTQVSGVMENAEVALDTSLDTNQSVTVALHSGNPATDNILASDTAAVTVAQDDGTEPSEGITRDIADTEVVAGGSTTVTVSVNLAQPVDQLNWDTTFSPAFANVKAVDTDGASFPTFENDQALASWSDVSEVTLVYEVTVPEGASAGDTFTIDGSFSKQSGTLNGTITGDDTVQVIEAVEADGNLSVADQDVPSGNHLIIDNANATVAYAVVVTDSSGANVGTSKAFDAGENISEHTVMFDEPLSESQELTVRLHTVTDTGEIGAPIETAAGSLETTVNISVGASAYTEGGEYSSGSVFAAIDDWRAGNIGPSLVFEVINNWRGS